jgi:hypothetical protein
MHILRALVFVFFIQAVLAQQPTPIRPNAKLTPGGHIRRNRRGRVRSGLRKEGAGGAGTA